MKERSSFYLISGADTVDEITLLKLVDTDYHSAMDKTLRCFLYHYENQTAFDFFRR